MTTSETVKWRRGVRACDIINEIKVQECIKPETVIGTDDKNSLHTKGPLK